MSHVAQNNLAVSLERQGRLTDAVAAYADAVRLKPDWPDPHANLGNALRKLGRLDQALPPILHALQLDPNHGKAHNFLGIVLQQMGRLGEALEAYQRAVALRPNDFEAWNNLGVARSRLGMLEAAVAAYRRSVTLRPNPAAHSNLLFTLHYLPELSPQEIFEEHLNWARCYEAPLLRHSAPPVVADRSPDRRLRIGYVSPDFREHTRALFVEPVLAHHDHGRFEVFCYSDVRQPDSVTRRMETLADAWRVTAALTDDDLAALIRNDHVDILVDLTGHMAGNRLLTLARRPAPLQMTWPGYPNTTGLSAIDYCVVDELRDPPGSDRLFSERLLRLDVSSQCYRPTEDSPPVGALPCTVNGHMTFASLNKPIKLTVQVAHVWSQILRRLPEAKLMVLANAGGERTILERSSAHGIAPERLELVYRLPRTQYLELHNRIDVNLDPWPYNGHTTTLDGLWMGVPAVVLEGAAHVSREGAACMRLTGLNDFVARDFAEYAEIAVETARNRIRLAQIRSELRQRLLKSPLMDFAGLTRRLESAYRHMWREWCDNQLSPRPIFI